MEQRLSCPSWRKIEQYMILAVTVTALTAVVITGLNLFASQSLPPLLERDAIPALLQTEPENPFAALYYYEADKQSRYDEYQIKNPELPADEVVWRVNAGLDQPFYTGISPVADTEAMPVIVNKYHQLAADYIPPNLEKLPSGKLATAETCAAYRAMAADARKEGLSLYAASAYRSYD